MRDFELEGRNRRQRQNLDNRERRADNVGGRNDEEPNQTSFHQRRDHSLESRRQRTRSNSRGPHQHRNRSRSRGSRRRSHSHSQESRQRRHRSHSYGHAGRGSDSPEDGRPYNVAMDAMSRALHRAARSPFSEEIERALMPSRFTRPPFNFYDG